MSKHCAVGVCGSPEHCAEIGRCFSSPPAAPQQEAIDAARYRWLKRQPWVKTKGIHAWGTLLDNAIDEARHDAPNG